MHLATGGRYSIMLARRKTTWYSVQDGNWSDPNTWISNTLDKKLILYPRPGDNVFINNNVTVDNNYTVNNIYGNGNLIFTSGFNLTVNGDIQITGSVDQTAVNTSLILNGYNNYIVNFTSTTNSSVVYNGNFDQALMNVPYGILQLNGISRTSGVSKIFYQTSNITCNSLNCSGGRITSYDFRGYNLTVATTTNCTWGFGAMNNTGASAISVVFAGLFTVGTNQWMMNFNSSDTIEFQNGISGTGLTTNTSAYTINFTTNNQTCQIGSGVYDFYGTINVATGITVTQTGPGTLQIRNVLNGISGTSKWDNRGTLYLFGTTQPMTTGTLFLTNGANVFGYSRTVAQTLWYTSYWSLDIAGIGTKTLAGNTTIAGILNFPNINCKLDTDTYNMTISGATTITGGNSVIYKGTSTGAVVFVGNVSGNTSNWYLDFATGAVVEFRAGINNVNGWTVSAGVPTYKFTTNNQSIINGANITFPGNFLISGAITVTLTTAVNGLTITGTLDGDNVGSIFDNRNTFNYKNATAPMATAGKIYCNQAANTFIYGLLGNQDIKTPSDPISPGYYNLTLNGSGAKRLLGNVSVKQVYTLTSPATLNSNGFSLTNP